MGKSLINEEKIMMIVDMISKGAYRETAARALGIDRLTLQRWLRLGRDGDMSENGLYVLLAELVEVADAEAEIIACKEVFQAGTRDWKALRWWLSVKYGKRFREEAGNDDEEETDELQVIG